MTIQEVNQLLAIMKANYSNAFKNMSKEDKHILLRTWAFTLQDLDGSVVLIASMQLISESKWLPTVAEIREKCKALYYSSAFQAGQETALVKNMEAYMGLSETDAQRAARIAREKTYAYIASATNHLRGDGESAGLQLETILSNPAFVGLTSGKSAFSMLTDGKYALNDGSEENKR